MLTNNTPRRRSGSFGSQSNVDKSSRGRSYSNLSNDSFVSERPVEFQRLYDLWQGAKDELSRKSRELALIKAHMGRDTLDAKLSTMNASENNELKLELKNMKEFCDKLQRDLNVAHAENSRWSQSYQLLSDEMQLVREMQESARRNSVEEETRVGDLSSIIEELKRDKERLITKSILEIRNHDEELTIKNQRITELERRIEKLLTQSDVQEEALSLTERKYTLENHEKIKREKEIQDLNDRIISLEKQIDERERAITQFNKSDLQIKIQHLSIDNSRLIELLQSTKEYEEFCLTSEGITFAPEISTRLPEDHLFHAVPSKPKTSSKHESCHEHCKSRSSFSESPTRGRLVRNLETSYGSQKKLGPSIKSDLEYRRWIPLEAVKLAAGFRRAFIPDVQLEIIQNFLIDLNTIWRDREMKMVREMKKEISREVEKFKRQNKNSVPYESFMEKQKSSRIENQRFSKSQGPNQTGSTTLAACLSEIQDLSYQLKLAKDQLAQRVNFDRNLQESQTSLNIIQLYDEAAAILSRAFKKLREIRKEYKTEQWINVLEEHLEDLDSCLVKYLPVTPSMNALNQEHKLQVTDL